jgi:hypothetical protein
MTNDQIITQFRKLSPSVDRRNLITFLSNRSKLPAEKIGALLKGAGL